MRRSDAVAIVAVLVTAVVGLAGISAGWLSAREERSSQRALARDDRVFDRRAAAYLDAIGFLERQNDAYVRTASTPRPVPFLSAPDLLLKERLITFGSTNVNREFQRAEGYARVTLDESGMRIETASYSLSGKGALRIRTSSWTYRISRERSLASRGLFILISLVDQSVCLSFLSWDRCAGRRAERLGDLKKANEESGQRVESGRSRVGTSASGGIGLGRD